MSGHTDSPPPLGEQARELMLRVRELEADRERYARQRAAAVLRAAAQEQRNEAATVPDTDEGTHADGHRCAADFLDRRADTLTRMADQ